MSTHRISALSSVACFSLRGHTALITGSTRGIGRSILKTFAAAGARVIAHGLEAAGNQPEITEVADGNFLIHGDISEIGGGTALARAALACGASHPDILVLNASVQVRAPWLEITQEDAIRQMQANFHSSLEILQTLVPGMVSGGWGRILVIGSVQQVRPHPDMAVYAASKCAQHSLVQNLARQLAPSGITINNLSPGVINTDRNTDALANPSYAETLLQKIPSRRFGLPSDCAGAALLLCSEAGSYITGQDLRIDGGLSL
jgi:NAD(P)-dependent dehydrogenase (short-subunit alcohol dehydrogenase family)